METTAGPAQADQTPQQSDASLVPKGTSVKKSEAISDADAVAVGPGDGKKKKKKKSKGKSKKKAATGFEEYFCDAPLTAVEYEEERDVYSAERPFHERIETCIQRFRARRRLNSARSTLFSQYLLLGGVDSTQRQFQGKGGIGDEDLEDASKDYIQAMTANDVIARGDQSERYYNPGDEHWTVDFTGVVSGFLSEWLPKKVGVESTVMRDGIAVVLNFLKYVLMHDVCPEYKDDILEAQGVCEKAERELRNVGKIWRVLPGYFNRAARRLFCAEDDARPWFPDTEPALDKTVALTGFHATLLAWLDPNRHREVIETKSISVTHTAEQDFVVIPIPEAEYPRNNRYKGTVMPRVHQFRQYKSVKVQKPSGHGGKGEETTLTPCGVVRLAPTTIEDGWDVGSAMPACPSWIGQQEDVFLETNIVKCLEPGSKLRVVICELNCGIKFIKEFKAVYPSFYVFLPQELMLKYKKPLPSERPGPSADDPDTMDADAHVDEYEAADD